MDIKTLSVPPLGANCYIVKNAEFTIVIDPGGAADMIFEAADRHIDAILLTHGHFDHAGGSARLASLTGAPIYVHKEDAAMLSDAKESMATQFGFSFDAVTPNVLFEDNETLTWGNLSFRTLHTPGHTAGSTCFLVGDCLFSGDTLFAGTVGIFAPEKKRQMQSSVRRLASLPPHTKLYPGHEGTSTIEAERTHNPFMNFNWEWE